MSVTEYAWLKVNSGQEAAFIEEARKFTKIVEADGGCRHVEVSQGVESPENFLISIDWDSIEAHKAFLASERAQQALKPFLSNVIERKTAPHYKSLGIPR